MGWLNKGKKSEEDEKKEELIKKGKELGLNLEKSMSIYELEHRIAEAEGEKKPEPKPQPSPRRGEH
jgi:hypothetical protein